jgi:hypothetical protein
LIGLPEHRVALAGGSRASQTDLFCLARARDGGLVAIAVEGKVDEPFGPLVRDWLTDASPGKHARLEQLCGLLALDAAAAGDLRYHLLHRSGSAILEARRLGATRALLLVHSFHPSGKHFSDLRRFARALGVADAERDHTYVTPNLRDPQFMLAWVPMILSSRRPKRPSS